MKRNVVKHGPSTMTMSLPSNWVKKNSIRAGTILDVQEKGNQLIVNTKKEEELIKLTVDIKNNLKTGIRYINCAYRKGCDELIIYYSDSSYLKRIEKCLSEEVIGFEIVKQGSANGCNFCVIKDLPGTKFEEFNTILERIWIIIISMSEDIINSIESKDKKIIEGFASLDKRINKFTNFCIRILNKNSHPDYKNIPIYYRFLRGLEELADYYKYLAENYSNMNPKTHEAILKPLKRLDEQLKLFFKCFYKPEDEYVEKLLIGTDEISQTINHEFKDKNDANLAHFLFGINNKIRNLTSAIIELNILNDR